LARNPVVRWTDINVKETSHQKLIQLLNIRMKKLGEAPAGTRGEIVFVADASPDPIAPGGIIYFPFPKFDAIIDGWTMVADAAGNFEVDIYKAQYPTIPSGANSIVAAAPPALVAAQIDRAVSVPTWNTRIKAEDTLGFEVTVASGVTRVTLSLSIEKL
jgi:hypothetical protein